ncbi:MAG: Ger(x)C family spore germination protein [Oscillospiraceae bacterium]|nr:Ger(x)C family spore germination protein [Oscillospiraceae bacterium]
MLCILIIVFLSVLTLTGCWDYQGLGEQTLVGGIAVDQGEAGRGYRLTFEIVDLEGGEGGQFGSILLTTHGETLAEAVYDAYAKLHGRMHLGVADVLIVGQTLAEREGLLPLVRFLMQDQTARNSLRIVVAGTDTAAELFAPIEPEGEENTGQDEAPNVLLSKILSESLSPRRQGARKAMDAPAVFEIYNILTRRTSDLVLPIISPSDAADIPFQLDGLALFTGDRMTGTLPAADMFAYLLTTANLRDRAFPIEIDGQRAVLTVRSSRPQVDYLLEDGTLRLTLNMQVTAETLQLPDGWNGTDRAQMSRLEAEAEYQLSTRVQKLIERLRDEGRDIFGFAETIRNRDPRLWEQIAADWHTWLRMSTLEVCIEMSVKH